MACVQKMSSQRVTRFQRRLEEANRQEEAAQEGLLGRGQRNAAGRRGRNPPPSPPVEPVVDPVPAQGRRRGAAREQPPAAEEEEEVNSDPEVDEEIEAEDPPPARARRAGDGPPPPPPDLAGLYERQTLVMERMATILEQGQDQRRYAWGLSLLIDQDTSV